MNFSPNSWLGIKDTKYRETFRFQRNYVKKLLEDANKDAYSTTIRHYEGLATGMPNITWEVDNCLDSCGVSHGRITTVVENDGLGHYVETIVKK